MRLLSFLSDVERAIIAESPVVEGGAWESTRMVNFQLGLGRVFLTARPTAAVPVAGGNIFIQAFALADGSQCLKATLSWKDSRATTSLAVYTTPGLNWKLEAARVAMAWLEGPPASIPDSGLAEEALAPLGATG